MDLSALGAIAGGINQGWSMAQQDQTLERNRQIQDETQAFLKQQRQQITDAQDRKNALRGDLQQVTKAGDYVYGDSDVGPTKTMQSAAGQARQEAAAYQKSGDDKTARELFRWANESDLKAAGQRYQSAMQSVPTNASPYDFAMAVAPTVDQDKSPVGIRNIKKNDDGSVSLEAYNKVTGYSSPQTFKDVKSMQDALTAHYSPELYADIIKRRQAAQDKIIEEQSKGHVVPAGGAFIPGVGDPRKQVNNENGLVWTGQYNPDGSPQMVKPMKDGSANGTGAGGKEGDPMKAYTDAFKLSATEGDTKLNPEQMRTGLSYLPALAGQKIDPQNAQFIAQDSVVNPAKTRLEYNHETGEIDRVYRNPNINRGSAVILARGAGGITDMEKQNGGPEQMRPVVADAMKRMVASVPEDQRQAAQAQLIQNATNPEMRKQYLERASAAGKDVGVLSRQLDLIAAYGKDAATPAAGGSAAPANINKPTITQPGGIYQPPAGSPAARALERRQQVAAEIKKTDDVARESQLLMSRQFNTDKSSMSAIDLARKYDSMRTKLPSADAAELQRIERTIR